MYILCSEKSPLPASYVSQVQASLLTHCLESNRQPPLPIACFQLSQAASYRQVARGLGEPLFCRIWRALLLLRFVASELHVSCRDNKISKQWKSTINLSKWVEPS